MKKASMSQVFISGFLLCICMAVYVSCCELLSFYAVLFMHYVSELRGAVKQCTPYCTMQY